MNNDAVPSHLRDARRIGQLEAVLTYLPHDVMFSPHFENVAIEDRVKIAKALEKVIADKLSRLDTTIKK